MIQCIAIDDEPLALQQIAGYIRKTPFLDLKAEFDSAIKAVSFLQENEIDLIIIAIRKRSKIGKLVFGSTAQYVILKAPCPVLSVK